MAWTLVPSLVMLRSEVNQLAPNRDKASDGSIGDTAHAASKSDHNPDSRGFVHAIDVDITGPWPAGLTMEAIVQAIVVRHRTGQDNRLQYVIYNRRIWSKSWGWTARAYGGVNPHDHHAHFSCRYDPAAESSTGPWGLLQLLEEDDTMTTKAEFLSWLKDAEVRKALATAVLAYDPGLGADGKILAGGVQNYSPSAQANPTVAPAWAISRAPVAVDVAYQIRDRVDKALVALQDLTGRDLTDENAIVTGVLAGLDPQAIAQAIPVDLAQRVADELAARLAA